MGKFTVSYTALTKFMSGCPYRYKMYKTYTREKVSPAEQFGALVHRYMEELAEPATPFEQWDQNALAVALKLRKLEESRGYTILAQEVQHIAPLTKDIQVFGIIDAIAEVDGEPLLIDYKTSYRSWKKITTEQGEVIVPKMMTFQAPIYLTKPYPDSTSDFWGNGLWPIRLDYLVAPKEGVTAIYEYYYNENDRQNLIRAATQLKEAVDAGWFPQNKGYECEGCDWLHCCWKTTTWQRYHKEKDNDR